MNEYGLGFSYWEDDGAFQQEYEEMQEAGWQFTQANQRKCRAYYRYYNDGVKPRGKRYSNLYHYNDIELELECDIDAVIEYEYRRFKKQK